MLSLDDVRALGLAGPTAVRPALDPHSTATIMYTSGTTGNPKGCQISHANWRAMLDAIEEIGSLGPGSVVYVYLPLAHMFTRMVQIVALELGATMAYSGGDIRRVIDELAAVRPTHLPSVPRLFEKVYAVVTTAVGATADPGPDLRQAVRAAFGGRVEQALTGAAPIAPEILEFFAACGVPIYEAYGMTEATAVITANRPGAVKFGTVGQPVTGVEVRITADGEVCSRSAGTFTGYWSNPEATAELVIDGWLHTGDLGALDEDGYLRITGRKKDIIITAAGKNLTPANLETELRRSRWISHAVMCGDRRPHPVVLITLDAEELLPWAAERGLGEDLAALSRLPAVHDLVRAALDEANARYAPPERIRDFAVLPNDFSIDAGELTPTLKIKRAVITARYADVVDGLY
ncbi:AMP-dependent synthetase/ligase [Jatrophihabitans sp.]|uniref:AMP-dependent synthetase/ligase n=1 Tax=Jatrophihabitans sp. TaxID=1932789 RepID=UPI0030C676BF